MESYVLFNYKGRDIIVREKGKKFQIGVRGKNDIEIWFESVEYDNIDLLLTSGREYARIMIDKMLLSRKKKGVNRPI